MFIIFYFLLLIIVSVGFYRIYLILKKRSKERIEGLSQVAYNLGFEFSLQGDAASLQGTNRLPLFSKGRSKQLRNLLHKRSNNVEVAIFDYDYRTGKGKKGYTISQSVIYFQFDQPRLPVFLLLPSNKLISGMISWSGYKDIRFDGYPIFSMNYLLCGDNENAIRMLFTDAVLKFYERKPGLSTETSGNTLLYYRHGQRVDPQDIRSFMEEGFKLLSLYHVDV